MKKQPQITELTQKKLIDSFWKLYQKEDVMKITVCDICKKAGYDRTTFYRYFNCISDILDYIEDTLINSIKDDIKNRYRTHDNNNKIIFKGFKSFNDKYGGKIVLFHEKGNRRFYHKFKELIKTDVYAYFKIDINDIFGRALTKNEYSDDCKGYVIAYLDEDTENLDFKTYLKCGKVYIMQYPFFEHAEKIFKFSLIVKEVIGLK